MATAVDIANLALARAGQLQPVSSVSSDVSSNGKLVALLYPAMRDALLEQFPWAFATKSVVLFDSTTAASPQNLQPGWSYRYQGLPADFIRALRIFNGARAGQPLLQGTGGWFNPPALIGRAGPEVPFEALGGAVDGSLFTDFEEPIPAWDGTINYLVGDTVSLNGAVYTALLSTLNVQPPSALNWQPRAGLQRQVRLLYIGEPDDDFMDTTPLFRDALAWKLAVEILLTRDPAVARVIEPRAEQAAQRAMAADLNGRSADMDPVSPTIAARY